MGHGESADMPKSEIHYEMGELEAFGQTHTQRLGNYNIDEKIGVFSEPFDQI